MPLTLRVRGPNGQATITCADDATLAQLQQQIADATQVPVQRQELLAGFPPAPLQKNNGGGGAEDEPQTVAAAGIAHGDSLTVRMLAAPAQAPPPAGAAAEAAGATAAAAAAAAAGATATAAAAAAAAAEANGGELDEDEALARAIAASLEQEQPPPRATPAPAPQQQQQQQAPSPAATPSASIAPVTVSDAPKDGRCPTSAPVPGAFPTRHAVRRVVASDNSCLFNAVAYAMEGASPARRAGPAGRRDPAHAAALRAVVARRVRGDPQTYTEAFLGDGRDAEAYARWIEQPKHWGGAVELAILSDYFRREIAAFCIQTTRVDVYGEGKGYGERAMLIYDGLHYDALAVAPEGSQAQGCEARDATVFDARGAEAAMAGAAALVAACHAARQFTDTANFTLRCGVCGEGLKGEKEAVVHAGKTGHQNFQEY